MSGCPARYDDTLGYWRVDDPALAREVLLDPQTFRPDNAVLAHTPLSVKALRVLSAVGFALPPTLANNGGASHRPIRAAVARFFSPARVAAIEPLARELNAERVAAASAALANGEQVDLVRAIAAEPPALVLLHLLGMTNVDVPALKDWSLNSLELFWGWPDEDRQLELAHSAAEFYAWLRARTTAARKALADNRAAGARVGGAPCGGPGGAPCGDLGGVAGGGAGGDLGGVAGGDLGGVAGGDLGGVAGGGAGGDLFGVLVGIGLTDEEVCAVGYFLLIAGQETTTQLISTAFHRSLGRTIDPPAVVEQVLRESSSVPTWRRITAAPTTLGDVDLPAGAPVLLGLTAHNGPADLAFGLGIHRCLGATLARLETRVALDSAQPLLPTVQLSQPPPTINLLSFRAPRQLLVTPRATRQNPPEPARTRCCEHHPGCVNRQYLVHSPRDLS